MNHKGFTLIELMISALIVGILTVMISSLILWMHLRWTEEKIRVSSMRNCEQIYNLIEEQLKTADREEIEMLMQQNLEEELSLMADGTNYNLDNDVEIAIEEAEEGKLFLTVSIISKEGTVLCRKTGLVLALNLTLKEKNDE